VTAGDFGLMAAVIGGSLLLAALLGWLGRNDRRDVGLLGGSGLALAAASVALLAA
jgi:hypothetical protein